VGDEKMCSPCLALCKSPRGWGSNRVEVMQSSEPFSPNSLTGLLSEHGWACRVQTPWAGRDVVPQPANATLRTSGQLGLSIAREAKKIRYTTPSHGCAGQAELASFLGHGLLQPR